MRTRINRLKSDGQRDKSNWKFTSMPKLDWKMAFLLKRQNQSRKAAN